MPDGMTTPEQPAIPESARFLKSLGGTPESVKAVTNPVNLLDDEARARQEAEGFYANQEREESYARRERLLNRLMNAEQVADIAAATEVLSEHQDWSKAEASDPYSYRYFIKAALDGARAFSKTHQQLIDEGIVKGQIGTDGYLENGGRVVQRGYATRVDQVPEIKRITIPHAKYDRDPSEKGAVASDKWWEVRTQTIIKEKVYFGTEEERKALANAYEQLMRTLIVGYKIHEHTAVFDTYRAALDELVGSFYQKQIGLTNEQIKWVFTAADINKISPERPNNQEAGLRRSKVIRALYLIGKCETKEEMEKHLNETFNLEKFIDEDIVQNALKIMEATNFEDPEAEAKDMPREVKVARFLIGKGLTYENGKFKVNWWTKDQRDPSKVYTEKEKEKRGSGAIKQEEAVRGYLTKFGNPFTRGSRDAIYLLDNRIGLLLGSKDNPKIMDDVKIADRLFWTWGERDELGIEIYSEENIPTGEELLENFNKLASSDYDKWREWADERLRYFSLPGEPVGSDLSKIFWPQYYRLKDLLNDRPTGPHLTVDKFKRFTQSMMTLGRTEVQINGELQTRSIREQFLGHKATDGLPVEEAKELGEIGWEQVAPPAEIEDVRIGEQVEVAPEDRAASEKSGVDSGAVTDNAYGYFWLMNFLAGDKNEEKRPWAFINDEKPEPKLFMKSYGFTAKNKFLTIVWHDKALVFGNWRKKYLEAARERKDVTTLIKEQAEAAWNRGRKDYFAGVRALPDYPTWGDIQIKYKDPESFSGKEITMVEFIERLAERFGFLSKENRRSRPQSRLKIV